MSLDLYALQPLNNASDVCRTDHLLHLPSGKTAIPYMAWYGFWYVAFEGAKLPRFVQELPDTRDYANWARLEVA